MQILWLVLVVVFIWASSSEAACTGSNPTWTSTPDRASVQTCVTNAAAGSTITVSAGNGGTWASSIPVDKSLKLIGAGIGQTTISGRGFDLGPVDGVEISGFTFASMVHPGSNDGFRMRGTHDVNFHHNSYTCTDWFQWVYTNSDPNRTRYVTGVFHHNTFARCRWVLNDGWNGTDNYSSRDGDLGWSRPDPLGTADMLFFEDNIALGPTDCPQGTFGINCNWIDTESGSRTVIRFNSLTNTYVECHPDLYSGHRGPVLMEVYGNTFDCTGNACNGFIRPGLMKCNSFWWHNQTTAAMGNNGQITMMDDRGTTITQVYGTAPCNGTFFIDGNTQPNATFRGWPCRDQPGTSTDAFKWDGSNPAPTQAYRPNYHWRNIEGASSTEFDYDVNGGDWNPVQIVANRDFFRYVSGFNGTSGVGEGTLAARPATCTTNPSGQARTVGWGPGYFATDQGSWNTSTSNPQGVQANGADGVLYVCAATNTWTVKYTPYTYPHPLQAGGPGGGGDTIPPDAPTNLRVQ